MLCITTGVSRHNKKQKRIIVKDKKTNEEIEFLIVDVSNKNSIRVGIKASDKYEISRLEYDSKTGEVLKDTRRKKDDWYDGKLWRLYILYIINYHVSFI